MIRIILTVARHALRWSTFLVTLWLVVGALFMAMPKSAVSGIALLVVLGAWDHLPKMPRWGFALALPFVSAALFLQFVGPEYMQRSNEIGCEVRHLWGQERSFCDDVEYERHDLADTGSVLSWREQIGIRWMNASMAVGGTLLGFEDVAYETMLLQTGSTSEIRERRASQTFGERRTQCEQGRATAERIVDAEGSIALQSSRARKMTARLARTLEDGQSASGRLRWRNYASRDQTWATTLALWVPQSELRVERSGKQLHTTWSGVILYPYSSQIAVTLPRLIGEPYRFALDEAMFCGAQLDGVFVPFRMNWHYDIADDDPWLTSEVGESSPGIVESLIRPNSNRIGFFHTGRLETKKTRADQ